MRLMRSKSLRRRKKKIKNESCLAFSRRKGIVYRLRLRSGGDSDGSEDVEGIEQSRWVVLTFVTVAIANLAVPGKEYLLGHCS